MHFGYTIIYVPDVAASLQFFETAFGLQRRFLAIVLVGAAGFAVIAGAAVYLVGHGDRRGTATGSFGRSGPGKHEPSS